MSRSAHRYFLTGSGDRVPVDSEGSCPARDCAGRLFHEYAEDGRVYAIRCPASLSYEQRARLRRADGTPIATNVDADPPV